jgi:hypothetical protein
MEMEVEGEGGASPPPAQTTPTSTASSGQAPAGATTPASSPPSAEDLNTTMRVLQYLLTNIPEARKAKYMYVQPPPHLPHCSPRPKHLI